ncbi:c-type cytochrome biogenesis protein CcmI [Halomonas sp. A29]|uniref:c-type cytochrome biogenesis protein CcmI n=1 Tax=Halomonas sp. A29 TaxID=3102786 RepID=UPI00398A6C8A
MNGLFLLLAMGLCVLALGFVVTPLLRAPRRDEGQSQQAINLAVHRDRARELEHDLAAGTLTRAQHDSALADLERELLDSGAIGHDEGPAHQDQAPRRREQQSGRRMPLVAAGISVAVLPFMATGLYLTVGHAEEVFALATPAGAMTPATQASPPSEATLEREFQHLVQQLQGRLAQAPDDIASWILLGRTLVFLDDLEAAERAFREAMAHGGERDPDLLIRYADVMAERQGTLVGEPQRLIERALAIDSRHIQGLWLAGSLAFQQQEMVAARAYWERLLAVLPEASPEAEVIRGNLNRLAQTAQPNDARKFEEVSP